jgi:BASS family bile acid:Na+ symporter
MKAGIIGPGGEHGARRDTEAHPPGGHHADHFRLRPGATVDDVLCLVRHPRMLVISLVSMFIVMPFIPLALVSVFDPPRVALVTLALSPVPPILLSRQRKAGGRTSYGLGLTAAVSVLAVVLVPALVAFLGQLMDRPFEMGPAAVAGQVVGAVVLPLAAGMLVRAFLPRMADRPEKPAALVANVVLLAAAVVVLLAALPRFAQVLTFGTAAAVVLFTVLGLAFGHLLAGPDRGDSAVLALASAVRHPGITLAVAGANFPSLDVGAAIVLHLLVGAVVCIPYPRRMHQRSAAMQAPTPAGRSERAAAGVTQVSATPAGSEAG